MFPPHNSWSIKQQSREMDVTQCYSMANLYQCNVSMPMKVGDADGWVVLSCC